MEMDREQHANALRQAMSAAGIKSADLATAMNVNTRTVGYWISRKDPVMPRAGERGKLKKIPGLENYEQQGADPVLTALARSTLVDWRRKAVESAYEKHLYEQDQEATG